MPISNDLPIESPADDRFGLDPFASAVAASIASIQAPSGVVLAVNGEWGSGKSSAINLIIHHLSATQKAGDLAIVPFNPWWFTGPDTLTLAFFQELNNAIGPSLPSSVKKSLAVLGQGVSAIGVVAGALANLKAPGLGEIVSGIAGLMGRLGRKQRTVEEEHRFVSEALSEQNKKFLIVIDDIDRLSPDDALTIFRLVKSVGRLPNVIYLLAFDRQIAERIVSERFPSEGPSYLAKIVQGAFDIPPPLVDVLQQQMLKVATEIMGKPEEVHEVRFLNVFYDVVAPMMRTPRDVVRLGNHLSTTWPAVASNVDKADFLALTALQLAEPQIYSAIRKNPDQFCGLSDSGVHRPQDIAQQYDALLGIADRPLRERDHARVALRRLFPRLDSVWGNMYHSHTNQWRHDRLVASIENFRSYFAFSASEDVVPPEQMEALIVNADNPEFIRKKFREALTQHRRDGSTKGALLLSELNVYAADIETPKINSLTSTLFSIGDELNVESDIVRGFGIGDNHFRLHWLFNRLINDRFEVPEREAIYQAAMKTAAIGWACNFTERCLGFFEPREDGRDRGPPIVSQDVAERFRLKTLANLRSASEDGTLRRHQRLGHLLFAWKRLAGGAAAEVRAWTDVALDDSTFVVAMAKAMPSESWSHGMSFDGMGDRVSRRSVRVNFRPYQDMLDIDRFENRISDIIQAGTASDEDLSQLRAFREIPRGSHDRGED